jgi:uncharacterized protein YpbB
VKTGEELDQVAQKTFSLLEQGKLAEALALSKELRMSTADKTREEIFAQEEAFLKTASEKEKATNNLLILVSLLGTLVG